MHLWPKWKSRPYCIAKVAIWLVCFSAGCAMEDEGFIHKVASGGGATTDLELRVPSTGEIFAAAQSFSVVVEHDRYDPSAEYIIVVEEWRNGSLELRREFREGICALECEGSTDCDPTRVSVQEHMIGAPYGSIETFGARCVVDGQHFVIQI